MTEGQTKPLPFDPHALQRELKRHYVTASDEDIQSMLDSMGLKDFGDLYRHIPAECRFSEDPALPDELSYQELQQCMQDLSSENRIRESYIGDALPHYSVTPVVDPVCSIRNLTTAYTPYQPERSQGTLVTHWIYQCLMSQLTGFEAVNSSLYDRATAIFEAMCTAVRLNRKADTVILSEGIFPGDRQVVETLLSGTDLSVIWIPLDPETGRTPPEAVRKALESGGRKIAGLVYPHINCLGILEDVDGLSDLTADTPVYGIAIVDPMLLGTGGLKPPTEFGKSGADIVVGEAQHLATGPNFGGPGLGLFAVHHNKGNAATIRQTPGRFVGKGHDSSGRDCLMMVISTREQHIRKEKATSNICSNQAYIATVAGAALLSRGESGMKEAFSAGRVQAVEAARRLTAYEGLRLAFPAGSFVNEITLETDVPAKTLIERARLEGIHLGVDVSSRDPRKRSLLKLSFSDRRMDLDRLEAVLQKSGLKKGNATGITLPDLEEGHLRPGALGFPEIGDAEIISYYRKLGELNVSPDDSCYPLGSCTMKYNPFINDWAANLEGFTEIHPQAPLEDAQGCLHLLYEIQEWFKTITGLPGITTQPVAGAQGELVGIKLFQAYHEDHGDSHRDVVLIPSSAHGTNFATAIMAGYQNKSNAAGKSGIIRLGSGADGKIDLEDLKQKIAEFGDRLAGVMITNPNTCGIFETDFRDIADRVHAAGGLVYMDGANMNAIAGWCDLGAMGVDAVHNNLHKTWSIPHGGGGPGDAIVGVSERLLPYLPGIQVEKSPDGYVPVQPPKSIGSFHRHWGNFAHKVRAYTYLLRLGREGLKRMSAMAVLSSRYCFEQLRGSFPTLPAGADSTPRMHEFIMSLHPEDFEKIEAAGIPQALIITRIGKLFLDFGFHAPTVAWPETFGLMIEPTESYSKKELDRFCEAILSMGQLVREMPAILDKVPLFTPVDRVDEVNANRNLVLSERLSSLPEVSGNRLAPSEIASMPIASVVEKIIQVGQ